MSYQLFLYIFIKLVYIVISHRPCTPEEVSSNPVLEGAQL